jgi:hypothetical protein
VGAVAYGELAQLGDVLLGGLITAGARHQQVGESVLHLVEGGPVCRDRSELASEPSAYPLALAVAATPVGRALVIHLLFLTCVRLFRDAARRGLPARAV